MRDLRHLPPPEPMEVILDAVDTPTPDEDLSFVLPHFPAPLIPLLEERGVAWRSEFVDGGAGLVLHLSRA